MISEIQSLIDKYASWLKDNTTLRKIDNWVEITTPYLDRHNDYLQIYAKRDSNGFLLTDDGYIIEDLEQTGCKLDTPKRKQLLTITLNGFGIKLKDQRLELHATKDNFAVKKHNLIQAMLAVNDLFYLAQATTISLFYEDVVNWLDFNEIRYTEKIKFTGKTGYDHNFDFVIPKSRKQPERIIRAINRPERNAAEALVFSWLDTKDVRPSDARAYALLNDSDQSVSTTVLDALKNYHVEPVLWSQRDNIKKELAA